MLPAYVVPTLCLRYRYRMMCHPRIRCRAPWYGTALTLLVASRNDIIIHHSSSLGLDPSNLDSNRPPFTSTHRHTMAETAKPIQVKLVLLGEHLPALQIDNKRRWTSFPFCIRPRLHSNSITIPALVSHHAQPQGLERELTLVSLCTV